MSNDYQNYMKGETKDIDARSSADAQTIDIAVSESPGKPGFGMLPGISIPLDHVLARQEFFRAEIERSYREGPDQPFMNDDSIASSKVVQTQKAMLNNYIMEQNQLPKADQAYNLFVPLADIAARSVVKADDVGVLTGHNAGQSPLDKLDKKEQGALRKAMLSEGLESRDSVSLKARNVAAQRTGMIAASRDVASVMNEQVIAKLRADIETATTDKQAIHDKIAKVAKWAGYVETGASLVAGGAGKLKALTAAPEADEGVGSKSLDKAESGAGHVGTGAGVLSTVATFGMQLYYADQLRALEGTIEAAKSAVHGWGMANEALAIDAKMGRFKEAASEYKLSVDEYQAAIDSRRTEMARVGAAADKSVDRSGKDQDTSQAVLWMTSVFEAQSFLGSALEAGSDAKATIDSTYSMVSSHRSPYSKSAQWGKVEDIWGGSSTPHSEGMQGADVQALMKMRYLTENWLAGATALQTQLDTAADGGVGEAMSKSGYSGKY